MPSSELALMAHLLRRAGFGATREELETYAARGYEETVEDLVNPERCPAFDDDIMSRYYGGEPFILWTALWIYRMVTSKRPLVEKMALFWHHVFATGYSKGRARPFCHRAGRDVPQVRPLRLQDPADRVVQRPRHDLLARQ